MTHCANCGEPVSGNFCANCGAKLISDGQKPSRPLKKILAVAVAIIIITSTIGIMFLLDDTPDDTPEDEPETTTPAEKLVGLWEITSYIVYSTSIAEEVEVTPNTVLVRFNSNDTLITYSVTPRTVPFYIPFGYYAVSDNVIILRDGNTYDFTVTESHLTLKNIQTRYFDDEIVYCEVTVFLKRVIE